MIKDIEKDNENVAINDKEIAVLREHFPACFKSDGSFDIERFKEELKDKVDIVHEGYELKFLGKSYAKLLASLDTTTVITPNTEHNSLEENKNSENIYISGDNLDGLKHLLKSYAKSVKCIYIDPPYNTGSDGFVYKDNFNFTADELQDKLSVDETQANRIIDLTKRNSASHSAWLMFMYARLQLAKDLLKDDGVIFISIDDNEQSNLKLLCDDIFGEDNFISQFIWTRKKKGSFLSKEVRKMSEYILCYQKTNIPKVFYGENAYSDKQQPIVKRTNSTKQLFFKGGTIGTKLSNGIYPARNNEDPTGVSFLDNFEVRDNIIISDLNTEAKYVWTQEFLDEELKNGSKVFLSNKFGFNVLRHNQADKTKAPSTLINKENGVGTNEDATEEISKLFNVETGSVFDYSKPVSLIKYLVNFIVKKDDIVLDFFSGSGTTAQSVIELNSLDSGNRKFIAIQLPENLNISNPSQKTAIDLLTSLKRPLSLDYIGIERIIKSSKIKEEETKADIDYGFKHFILNEPNQNTLDKCDTFDKAGLVEDATIIDNFGTETVLTTWLNNDGYGLNAKVQTIDLNGYEAYYCQKHLYLINPYFTQEAMVSLVEKYDTIGDFNPDNIVLFGYSFIEWSATEMLEKNLKVLNDSEKNLKINIDVRY